MGARPALQHGPSVQVIGSRRLRRLVSHVRAARSNGTSIGYSHEVSLLRCRRMAILPCPRAVPLLAGETCGARHLLGLEAGAFLMHRAERENARCRTAMSPGACDGGATPLIWGTGGVARSDQEEAIPALVTLCSPLHGGVTAASDNPTDH